jgi:predicted RNase H-like nuclease (RuvC/YqgF family)
MSDTKRKISAWIPAALYDEIEKAGYTSPTIAVTKGLELLVRTQSGDNTETSGHKAETIGDSPKTVRGQLEIELNYLKKEIERLNIALQVSPDPVEFAEVRAHFTGNQRLLEEKDERIKNLNREVEGLQKEVERLDMFAHYFKSVEVKQIEAPATEKVKPWWRFW